MSESFPSRASAVIVGGGVIGASVAYHLARLGWQDVALLERRQFACGTTWHAAGLIGTVRANESHARLCEYSMALLPALAAEAVAASRSPELAAASLEAWRRAEAAETDGSPNWLAARARRIAGLHAAGRRDEAARLLAVTRLLHPNLSHAAPAVRRRFAPLGRALGEPTDIAAEDARRPAPPRR